MYPLALVISKFINQHPAIIHGLIGFTDKGDHIFMDLIESAKFDKGKNKPYKSVAGNPVAFGCKMAFELNMMVLFLLKCNSLLIQAL